MTSRIFSNTNVTTRRKHPGNRYADDLPDKDPRALLNQTKSMAVVDVPTGSRGKNARQQRSQGPTHSVHAKGVQGIVVAQPIL